jgi:serine/threonine-protein kinase RsbW
VEALSELVLAADEAATTLISHTHRFSTLACVFDIVTDPSVLRVVLTATTSSPADTSTSSFGWLVLQTLVDHVALEQTPTARRSDCDDHLAEAVPARS